MKTLLVLECLFALVPIFLEGCTVYDANGHPSTVVPIMGTDEYGNPTMTWCRHRLYLARLRIRVRF
jgi:hypothetical protein